MTARRITFLTEVHARPDIAQRCVDEFEAYFSKRESVTFGYYEPPEMTCYCFSCPIREIKRQIEYNYREIKKMYDAGFRPYPGTPMLCAIPDLGRVYDGTGPYVSTICMSVDPETIPDPARVVRIRRRQAFSLLYHGNGDEIMENGGRILFDEMKRRGLVPAGPLFGINVVGVFFGNEIAPEDYVFRFAIPIE